MQKSGWWISLQGNCKLLMCSVVYFAVNCPLPAAIPVAAEEVGKTEEMPVKHAHKVAKEIKWYFQRQTLTLFN